MLSLLPLDNEFVLWLSLLVIAACVVYELMQFHDKRKELESIDYRTLIPLKQPRNVSFLFPPVHESCPVRTHVCLDLLALAKYIPLDAKMNTPQRLERHVSQSVNSAPRSPKKVAATERKKHEQVERYTNDIYSKIMDPLPPDCQPQSNNVNALLEKHPDLTRVDIVRFLVARKGNQQLADEMILKFKAWRSRHFPLRRSNVETALRTRCVFPFGTARDGTPVIYFRGGLYDNTKASAEAYVLAGAHCIDYIFQQYPLEVNITIVVHTGTTKEGPNAAADTNFLKLFISTLSDNYPERLKRFILYPFPWYGRAIWSFLKVFVDKRTQDKVNLLAVSDANGLPTPLLELLAAENVPMCLGGSCADEIVKLEETIPE